MGRFKIGRGLFLPPYILSDDLKRTRCSANLICAPVGEQHGGVEKSTPISSRRADGGLSKGVEKSEVPLTPLIHSCKPDAKKKNAPTDKAQPMGA